MTERFPTDNELQCAWDDYLDAKDHAERTRNLNDSITAGRLWRRYCYLYCDPDKILKDNTVVSLPSRRERQSRGQAL